MVQGKDGHRAHSKTILLGACRQTRNSTVVFVAFVLVAHSLTGCAGNTQVREGGSVVAAHAPQESGAKAVDAAQAIPTQLPAPETLTAELQELPEPRDLLTRPSRELIDSLGTLVKMGRYFYLGANGELISDTRDRNIDSYAQAKVAVELQGNRIKLWVALGYPLATVDLSGRITLQNATHTLMIGKAENGNPVSYTATVSGELLPEFPTVWPYRDANGGFALPPPGTILSRSLEGKRAAPAPPVECRGWLLQTVCDGLLAPTEGMRRPPDVLWIMPAAAGGFSLVHSGPRHQGLYAVIEPWSQPPNGSDATSQSYYQGKKPPAQMFYGADRRTFPEPNVFSQQLLLRGDRKEDMESKKQKSWWQAYTDEKRSALALLPPGACVFPHLGATDYQFMVVENGECVKRTWIPIPVI